MDNCDVCQILANKNLFKLVYEDDICFAILHESPASVGHTLVIPKEHSPIIEELSDSTVEHLFNVCNQISTAIFEQLGSHGTNIILNNGIDAGQELPHVVINVLPRTENDGLNIEWTPKQANEADLKVIANRIKNFSDSIFSGKDELPKTKIKDKTKSIDKNHDSSQTHKLETNNQSHEDENNDEFEEEDYLLKTFRRTP
jgi:histidine triad (HIT) family protein